MSIEYSYKSPSISEIPAPYIPNLIIKNLLGTKQNKIEVLIDTGYDGYLVIPIDFYEELDMTTFEIVQDEVPQVETFTGEKLTLKTANGIIEIPQVLEETVIEIDAHPHCKEPLMGRQLLEFLVITLNGVEKRLEIT